MPLLIPLRVSSVLFRTSRRTLLTEFVCSAATGRFWFPWHLQAHEQYSPYITVFQLNPCDRTIVMVDDSNRIVSMSISPFSTCPQCGATDRDSGKLYLVGSNYDVRYLSDKGFPLFSLKKKVQAFACFDCGHITLAVAEWMPSPSGTQSEPDAGPPDKGPTNDR